MSYKLLSVLLILLFFLLPIEPISFDISSFDPNIVPMASNVSFQGDATVSNGAVELNRLDYFARMGRVTYSKPVRIWDSTTKNLTDFTTRFSFTIDTLGASLYSDGISFFLAPIDFAIPLNSEGQFFGLYNTTTLISQVQIVVVEFDSYVNYQWDPPFEHVGINVHSPSSVSYVNWNASLHSGETAHACISYSAAAKKLTVLLSYDGEYVIHNSTYNLSYDIDLRDALPELVQIGFSATTGIYSERHILHSWEFTSTLESIEVEIPTVPRQKKDIKDKVIIALSIVTGILMVVAVVAIRCCVISRRNHHPIHPPNSPAERQHTDMSNIASSTCGCERVGPIKFSYEELVAATNNFALGRLLGQGGYAAVYIAFTKRSCREVAVKRILNASEQGRRDYEREVEAIGLTKHKNLVELIGWCHEGGEFLLVCEFMPNGSLDKHLFGDGRSLQWPIRYKIACGLASALVYLHEDGTKCTVHRDIKSSNVLLDSNFNCKLGDFGLARLMDHGVYQEATYVAGTKGYMAPECFDSSSLHSKLDVFSFGVVVLEIATGRKAVETMENGSRCWLVNLARDLYRDEQLFDAVDQRLNGDFVEEQMKRLMIVGLSCVQRNPDSRPAMREVIRYLNFEAPMPNPPTNMQEPDLDLPSSTSIVSQNRH